MVFIDVYYTPYITLVKQKNVIFYYNFYMGFAENLRNELDFQDIQIKELAGRTGISKNTLDKYLSGKKVQPGVENAVKIAQALGVSVEYLTLGTPCEKNESLSIPQEYRLVINQYQNLNDFNRKTVNDILLSLISRQ